MSKRENSKAVHDIIESYLFSPPAIENKYKIIFLFKCIINVCEYPSIIVKSIVDYVTVHSSIITPSQRFELLELAWVIYDVCLNSIEQVKVKEYDIMDIIISRHVN